jgi:hypothetical protein
MRPFRCYNFKKFSLEFPHSEAKILFNIQAFKDWNWLFVFI